MFNNACTIVDDTLKRDKDNKRRFSKTALTMLSAWLLVIYVFIDDYAKNGFRSESFYSMLAVATGIKVSDAIAKKFNKMNNSQ